MTMKKHILSVDDEPDIRELLSESLTMAGYRVSTAALPDDAKRIVKDDPPNLIILDFQIEEGDGLMLIDEIRAMRPGVPIMLLTGAVFGEGAVRDAIERKVDSYLDKTASLSVILAEVDRLLRDKPAAVGKPK
jgi:two-component system OmpR family response regulator